MLILFFFFFFFSSVMTWNQTTLAFANLNFAKSKAKEQKQKLSYVPCSKLVTCSMKLGNGIVLECVYT